VDAVRRHRVILIQIERHDVPERQTFVAVHPDELSVDADRRRPRGKSEDRRLTRHLLFANEVGDAVGDESSNVLVVVDDDCADALPRRNRRVRDTKRPASRCPIAGLLCRAGLGRSGASNRASHSS
jgi:hypothetical protein